jgi:iron-sulfur cluster assembly protein
MALIEEKTTESVETDVIITVSELASEKIKELFEQRGMHDHALRVFVAGGGCSGLQYGMAFEPSANIQEFDSVVDVEDGVRLVVDPTSLMYVRGAHIDFVDSLMGGGFRIDNPNAVSTCGCGTSFQTKDHAAGGGGCSSCG